MKKTQLQRLREHFDKGLSLTPGEALAWLDIYALSQRCGELVREGYPLDSRFVKQSSGASVKRYFKKGLI